jgi:hypothetical protein
VQTGFQLNARSREVKLEFCSKVDSYSY